MEKVKGRLLITLTNGKTESIRTSSEKAEKIAKRYLNKVDYKFYPNGSRIPKMKSKKQNTSNKMSLEEMEALISRL